MPAACDSLCRSCSGTNLKTFDGEVAIHFPGLDGLNKPIVWVFTRLGVCLNCGFTELIVPDRELRVLTDGKPVEGAVLLYQRSAPKARTAV